MRLNKELRTKIVENAYKASPIPEAEKALTARSMALAEKIRIYSFGEKCDISENLEALRKELKLLMTKRIGEGAFKISEGDEFKKSTSKYVDFGEKEYVAIRLDGALESDVMGVSETISKWWGHGGRRMKFAADHEFTQEYRSIINDAKDLKTQAEVLRNTVQAAVDSFTTVEKLVEHWPECAPLIPKEVSAASQPMPIALQTDTLNKLIGLPK